MSQPDVSQAVSASARVSGLDAAVVGESATPIIKAVAEERGISNFAFFGSVARGNASLGASTVSARVKRVNLHDRYSPGQGRQHDGRVRGSWRRRRTCHGSWAATGKGSEHVLSAGMPAKRWEIHWKAVGPPTWAAS